MDKTTDPCKSIRIAMIMSIVGLVATAVALVVVVVSPRENTMSFEQAKRYVSKLANSELYSQAVDELERILENYRLTDKEAGSILYQIGTISADHLHDPSRALAAFIRFQELYPNSPLKDDVDRKVIAQLDKMGRSKQAQNMLEKAVTLGKPIAEAKPSRVVARIGDRAITSDEVEQAIADLPSDMADRMGDPQMKSRFLHDYVGEQLLYGAAIRAGYDKRPEIIDRFESAQKNIVVAAYFKDRIADRIDIKPSDVDVYYQIHKADFGNKPLDQVRRQVEKSLRAQKMSESQRDLFDELMETEKVQLFPENLTKNEE